MKLTYPTTLVLQALMHRYHYGFDIMDATGLPSGTVYPILRRLDREGFVCSRWESDAEAHRAQRPPRRYYELTAAGEQLFAEALNRYRALHEIVPRPANVGPTFRSGRVRPARRPATP